MKPIFGVTPGDGIRPLAVCAACGGVAHGTVALATITTWLPSLTRGSRDMGDVPDPETRTDRDLAFCQHCIAQLSAGLTVDVKVWEEDHL